MFQTIEHALSSLTFLQEGVDYIFSVLGSDHPSLIEAFHKRRKAGKNSPELLVFNHEVSVHGDHDATRLIKG